ncbi:MAG: peptide MFS transporter, partial [Chitinophagaceae bacterium]
MEQSAAEQGASAPHRKGHPMSLYVCFFTEMWERFGYYLMIAIFLLYLIDPVSHGGKGFDIKHAADLVGTFIALVYLTPFIGGLLADRYLGYRRSIIIGGILLAAGYIGLSLPGMTAMYISLLLIIIGNGFFKPNISTILGNIYNREDLKPKKDIAYNIFYMGINIGALISPFAAAAMRNHFGWGAAFATAGVGMIIGLIWFIFGMGKLKEGDVIKPKQKEDMPMSKILVSVFVPAILAAILGWFINVIIGHTIFGTRSNDAFMFACVPIVIFYLGIFLRSTKEDRRGLGALFAFFLVSIVFWVIYNQNSTGLTIWADQYTNREIPVAVEKVAKPMGILQNVTTQPEMVTDYNQFFQAQKGPNGEAKQVMGLNPY